MPSRLRRRDLVRASCRLVPRAHPVSVPARLVFFTDTATTELYTLSLHDALPICPRSSTSTRVAAPSFWPPASTPTPERWRSEEHTSELQSHHDLVCRLLLEKKNGPRPDGGSGSRARQGSDAPGPTR